MVRSKFPFPSPLAPRRGGGRALAFFFLFGKKKEKVHACRHARSPIAAKPGLLGCPIRSPATRRKALVRRHYTVAGNGRERTTARPPYGAVLRQGVAKGRDLACWARRTPSFGYSASAIAVRSCVSHGQRPRGTTWASCGCRPTTCATVAARWRTTNGYHPGPRDKGELHR